MSTKSQVLGLQWIQRAARSVQEGATFGQILFFYLKQEVELKVLFKPQTALSVVVVCFLWTERDSNIWKRASHRSINEHNRTMYLTFQLETRNEGLCNKDTKDGTQTFSFFFFKPSQATSETKDTTDLPCLTFVWENWHLHIFLRKSGVTDISEL